MGLFDDAQVHWTTVETETKRALKETFAGDDDGKFTAEQLAGRAAKNFGLSMFLWADGFRIMSENADEFKQLMMSGSPFDGSTAAEREERLIALIKVKFDGISEDDAKTKAEAVLEAFENG